MKNVSIRIARREDCVNIIKLYQEEICNDSYDPSVKRCFQVPRLFYRSNRGKIRVFHTRNVYAETEEKLLKKINWKDFEEKGFLDEKPAFFCLLAEDEEGNLKGCAVLSLGYATWEGRRMFLEDFVICKNLKKTEFEEEFFKTIFQEAIKRGCASFRSISDEKSELGRLICDYKGYNSTYVNEWHIYSINKENIYKNI